MTVGEIFYLRKCVRFSLAMRNLSRSIFLYVAAARSFRTFVISAAFVFGFSPVSGQSFTDIAGAQGVSAIPNSLQYGSGMSFYDFNQDGWDDLSFTLVDDSCVFYINNLGTFQQVPAFVDGPGQTKHLVWVDYDNDGDLDIGRTTFEGHYSIFQNDGDFNFTDVSEDIGLGQGQERYYGMCFADYDRDGDLDFYVTCYEQLDEPNYYDKLNHLYQNNGDGTFDDVTTEAGVGDGIRLSFKGVWFDYDMDGWPDLFVINDRIFENSLYKNNGDGTFTDVSEEAGIQLGGQDPMTATVGDFDNDGDMDVYMTNTSAPAKRGQLLVNNGDGTFTQAAEEYGVDVFGWTWGAIWVDYDNDTDQDLYVAHGHPNLGNFDIDNFFLESAGGAFFTDASTLVMGEEDNTRSYSNARGDIDNDGFYDIAVLNRSPFDVNLWHNAGNDNHFIKFTLTGTASNVMAIGSWIRVYIDGMQFTQYTMCGENYIGQNSQHHIFGLGDATVVDSVKVEYVLGHTDTYYDLSADSSYHFTEGETYSAEIAAAGSLSLCAGDSVVLDAGQHEEYSWNTGHDGRFLTVFEAGQYWFTAQNAFGIAAQSDTVTVVVNPQPNVEPVVSPISCFGAGDGAVLLQNLSGVPVDSVSWSNGMTGATIDSLQAGSLNYTLWDANGCSTNGEILIQEPQALNVQVFSFPEVSGADGSISLIINGGVPPYEVFLDTMAVDPDDISGLTAGDYTLAIVDANGCIFSQSVTIGSLVNIRDLQLADVQVYPNPALVGGTVQVALPPGKPLEAIALVDTKGRIIRDFKDQSAANDRILINLQGLSAGAYRIAMLFESGDTRILALTVINR